MDSRGIRGKLQKFRLHVIRAPRPKQSRKKKKKRKFKEWNDNENNENKTCRAQRWTRERGEPEVEAGEDGS